MTEAHPVASTFVKNAVKNGGKLIVVDPRRHRLADYADIVCTPRSMWARDVAFLNGIMHVLLAEELNMTRNSYRNTVCAGFEEIQDNGGMEYPPERGC